MVTNDISDVRPRILFYPHHMEGTYTFGDLTKPFLTVGLGIFPFKYNPDVRNLGEYLFRSGTYPQYLINDFDFAASRLTGIRFSFSLFDSLNLNAMLLDENQMVPYNDYGIALLGDYTFAKALTVGGGVFFSHLFSTNDNYTQPKSASNMYFVNGPTDTNYYTFRGTKLMGRISFDPKVFFQTPLFKKDDLRIYGEINVLGWKDYPVYYTERWRRMPISGGINLPTFGLLDVLSSEVEWYANKYPNSYWKVIHFENVPIPGKLNNETVPYNWEDNTIKWSFFAQKQITNNFRITAQVARDHWRLYRHYFMQNDVEETMKSKGDWGWIMKGSFYF